MFTNKKISELVGSVAKYKDHVGVEIELEHETEPKPVPESLTRYWNMVGDGSLRVNGAEYVLREPKTSEIAKTVVEKLGKHINDTNNIVDAGRAGVHVHINVGDLTVRETVNFIALWHCLEPLIVHWCGEQRKGNLFCLRLKDAEFIVDVLQRALEEEQLRVLHTDEIRYAAINLKAIQQYGSIEFRCMRSDGNWDDINTLIDVLLRLKTLARQIDSPVQIVADSSNMGREVFVDSILGEYAGVFEKYVGYEDDLYEAVRRIQMYAYCKEW